MKNFDKFLTPEEEQKKATEWEESSEANETIREVSNSFSEVYGPYDYIAYRVEGKTYLPGEKDIAGLHGVSFINEVIPELLSNKKLGEKVKILDVGGGAGLYAKQIRKVFPNQVKVYTTGLSKRTARFKNPDQHSDDLKWRSVRQLSRFEEFDLIIDTYGEAAYGVGRPRRSDPEGDPPEMEQYLEAVIEKLNPGGIASIVTNIDWHPEHIKMELEKRYPGVFVVASSNGHRLHITKKSTPE